MPQITETFMIAVQMRRPDEWICRFRRKTGSSTNTADIALRRCMDKVYGSTERYQVTAQRYNKIDNIYYFQVVGEVGSAK